MALVLLRPFSTSMEAAIARSFLLSEGIETFVFDAENEWHTGTSLVPVRLMVAEEDLELADRLLADRS